MTDLETQRRFSVLILPAHPGPRLAGAWRLRSGLIVWWWSYKLAAYLHRYTGAGPLPYLARLRGGCRVTRGGLLRFGPRRLRHTAY